MNIHVNIFKKILKNFGQIHLKILMETFMEREEKEKKILINILLSFNMDNSYRKEKKKQES